MLRLALMVMLLMKRLGFSACKTAYMAAMEKMGYAKRDILSSCEKSARDAQEEAKKDIQSALNPLVKDMNRSIAEADKFIQSMEKEPA